MRLLWAQIKFTHFVRTRFAHFVYSDGEQSLHSVPCLSLSTASLDGLRASTWPTTWCSTACCQFLGWYPRHSIRAGRLQSPQNRGDRQNMDWRPWHRLIQLLRPALPSLSSPRRSVPVISKFTYGLIQISLYKNICLHKVCFRNVLYRSGS